MTSKTHRLTFLFMAGILAASVAGPASARQNLVRDGTYPESFSYIGGIREMADGRLMIADPLEKSLMLVNFDRGSIEQIGREGGGPQEYRQPDAVYALQGDTTLMVDLGNSRFTIINPDGSFGETKPLTSGQPGSGTFTVMLPEAVDRNANVYFQARGNMARLSEPPDSAWIVRMNWATGAVDTVGSVKLPARTQTTSGSGENRNVVMRPVPLSPQDDWTASHDGRVVFVRSSPYRVEWVDRNGRVTRGPAVPVDRIPVRRAEQQAWLEEPTPGGMQIGIANDNGVISTQMTRTGSSSGGRGEIRDYEWPEQLPIFRGGRSRVDMTGNVWVQRYSRAGEPSMLDVFGPDGNLRYSLEMPEGRRIVGFGTNAVYMISMDEFDLQYLERYRIET